MTNFRPGKRISGEYVITIHTKKDQGLLIITELMWNGCSIQTRPEEKEYDQFETTKLIFISTKTGKRVLVFDYDQHYASCELIRRIRQETIEKFLADSLDILPRDINKMKGRFTRIVTNQFLQLSESESKEFMKQANTHTLSTPLGVLDSKGLPKTRALVTMKTIKAWNDFPITKANLAREKANEN